MIINDVILENRALNVHELRIIDELRQKGSNAGDMFSEVGPYLTIGQFKCLARWILAKNMPTIVNRRKSSMMDSEDTALIDELLLLELKILFGLDNSIISESRLDEGRMTSFFSMFGTNIDDLFKSFLKKSGDVAKKSIPVIPKDVPKELLKKTKDAAGKLLKRPNTKTISGQTNDLIKLEKNLSKQVEKKLSKELPDALKQHAPKLADEGTKGFLYKSGLKVKEFKALRKAGQIIPRLSKWILGMMRRSARTIFGLGPAVTVAPWAANYYDQTHKMYKAGEALKSGRHSAPKVMQACDEDAHNIRNILRKHGWLMSATPTGY